MPTPPDAATEPPSLSAAPAPPPLPIPSPPLDLPSVPAEPPPALFLDEAEENFEAGRYADAALAYQTHLRIAASDEGKDKALFRLALATAFSDQSSQGPSRARVHLQQLVLQYPSSPYAQEAQFILDLIQEVQKLKADVREKEERVKRLSDELRRLKRIDLQRPRPRAP